MVFVITVTSISEVLFTYVGIQFLYGLWVDHINARFKNPIKISQVVK